MGENFLKKRSEIYDTLTSIGFQKECLIALPLDGMSGKNFEISSPCGEPPTLISALNSLFTTKTSQSLSSLPLVFCVLKVVPKRKTNTIILGKVQSGTLRTQDKVLVLPIGVVSSGISTMEVQHQQIQEASPENGIVGITLAPGLSCRDLNYGHSILLDNKIRNTTAFLAKVRVLGPCLKANELLLLAYSTMRVECRVYDILKIAPTEDSLSLATGYSTKEGISNSEILLLPTIIPSISPRAGSMRNHPLKGFEQ